MGPLLARSVLIVSLLWFAWLAMMLVHEMGHVVGAVVTGGAVRAVIWHPTVLSRTDVDPNPHPFLQIWAGPIVGSVVPVLLAAAAHWLARRRAYLLWAVAGFCLIANGVYLGVGMFDPIGDARELINHGTPRWVLGAFGIPVTLAGFWIWHRVGAYFGLGPTPKPVASRDAWAMLILAVAITLVAFVVGERGAP